MGLKLSRWFVFGVVIASLPVLFNLLRAMVRGGTASLSTLTGRGELLLVAAAIAAAAIGDLVASGEKFRVAKIFAGGGAVVVLFLASLVFADVTAEVLRGESVQSTIVGWTSLWLFGVAVLASGSCVALAEVK